MEALVRQVQQLSFTARHFSTSSKCLIGCHFVDTFVRQPYPHAKGPPVGKHHPRQNPIRKLTRMRCVDNSAIGKQAMAEGKPPKVIHIYNKISQGDLGDVVLCTVKGEMKKGVVVGTKRHQRAFVPKFDSNNVVLIDHNGTPLGTRIHVPIPMILRELLKSKTFSKGPDYTKLLAIATKFI